MMKYMFAKFHIRNVKRLVVRNAFVIVNKNGCLQSCENQLRPTLNAACWVLRRTTLSLMVVPLI